MIALPLLLSFTYFGYAHAFATLSSRQPILSTPSKIVAPTSRFCPRKRSVLRMAYDDEEEDSNNPLSKGIDSVSWLPSVMTDTPTRRSMIESSASSSDNDVETLPLFPLGNIVYTPNSEHILNIFEPRYREMYNDILENGSKRFVVVMCHPTEEGRFASVGVLFNLEELKEVSEQTNDQVKYICNHRVTGRVKLHEVVNPEVWETRETYLKVKGTIIDDTGYTKKQAEKEQEEKSLDEKISKKLVDTMLNAARADSIQKSPEEQMLFDSFSALVELQHDMEEDVRFTRASVKSFGIAEGTDIDPNLWTSIRLWQSYAEQRLVATQNEMQKEFQEKLVEYLKKEMGTDKTGAELPSAIGFDDLSPSLQEELMDLQKQMTRDLKPLMLEQTLSMQKILEAENHTQRVELLQYFVDAERKRLQARKLIKSVFGAAKSQVSEEVEEKRIDESKNEIQNSPRPSFYDDEDAFQ